MKSLTCAILTALATGFFTTAQAQQENRTPAQAYADSIRALASQFSQDMQEGVAASESEFEAYKEAQMKEFENFKDEMERLWGEYKNRSKKEWVEYKDGGKTRVQVDFETGQGKIEVIVENPEEIPEAEEELPEKVIETINSKGTEMGFEYEELPNEEVLDEPVLKDQIDKEEDETEEEFAERVVEENVQTSEVVGDDGIARTVITVNFNLAPDHISTRAEKISAFVYDFAEEFDLDPPLIFAIIHTESFFNPMAASAANAYGLMQLVPTSGGRDAYRKVFNKDGIPTQQFLFEPKNNVNLGCAYVDILLRSYLRDVSDNLSKSYLAISAYNTGTGNVYKAYDQSGSKSKAMAKIEAFSPEENYNFLIENLPYEETRDYLKKVVDRSKLYEGWAD